MISRHQSMAVSMQDQQQKSSAFHPHLKRGLVASLMVVAALGMSACGNKDKKGGQTIAVVNGEEITQHQLNNEMMLLNVPAAQQEAAQKQALESLVNVQLLVSQAIKDKTDRDPKVMQTLERAKSQIIAQAYMQKKLASVVKPTKTEIEEYYKKNPQFFGERKVFDMKQIQFAAKDLTDEVKKMLDAAKSLDEVAAFMTEKKIQFGRGNVSRSGSDLPEQMTSKLLSMPKEQLFQINEAAAVTLLQIAEIKDAPVSLEVASRQIEQFLLSKKNKEASDAEIKRLRDSAKIEYTKTASASASASASAAASAASASAK